MTHSGLDVTNGMYASTLTPPYDSFFRSSVEMTRNTTAYDPALTTAANIGADPMFNYNAFHFMSLSCRPYDILWTWARNNAQEANVSSSTPQGGFEMRSEVFRAGLDFARVQCLSGSWSWKTRRFKAQLTSHFTEADDVQWYQDPMDRAKRPCVYYFPERYGSGDALTDSRLLPLLRIDGVASSVATVPTDAMRPWTQFEYLAKAVARRMGAHGSVRLRPRSTTVHQTAATVVGGSAPVGAASGYERGLFFTPTHLRPAPITTRIFEMPGGTPPSGATTYLSAPMFGGILYFTVPGWDAVSMQVTNDPDNPTSNPIEVLDVTRGIPPTAILFTRRLVFKFTHPTYHQMGSMPMLERNYPGTTFPGSRWIGGTFEGWPDLFTTESRPIGVAGAVPHSFSHRVVEGVEHASMG